MVLRPLMIDDWSISASLLSVGEYTQKCCTKTHCLLAVACVCCHRMNVKSYIPNGEITELQQQATNSSKLLAFVVELSCR